MNKNFSFLRFSSLQQRITSSCLLCNSGVRGLRPLCMSCEQALPWNTQACLRCAMPLQSAGHVCGDCLQKPPLFQRAVCPFRYEHPVAGLLNRYKHDGKLLCGYWLAECAAEFIAEYYQQYGTQMPACIMPVPLHWRRVRQRGFDQGLEIARAISKKLALPVVNNLRRLRNTGSQQGLNREQRQHNLEGAFALAGALRWPSVALVDDVLTTGSTATEIVRCLHAAGITEVHVWALARTP